MVFSRMAIGINTDTMAGTFCLPICIGKGGMANTTLTDTATGEEYILYKANAIGPFMGKVRSVIDAVLHDVACKWDDPMIFKTEQTLKLIEFIRQNMVMD